MKRLAIVLMALLAILSIPLSSTMVSAQTAAPLGSKSNPIPVKGVVGRNGVVQFNLPTRRPVGSALPAIGSDPYEVCERFVAVTKYAGANNGTVGGRLIFQCGPFPTEGVSVFYIQHQKYSGPWGIDWDSYSSKVVPMYYVAPWYRSVEYNEHRCVWPGQYWIYQAMSYNDVLFEGVWYSLGYYGSPALLAVC